MVSILLKINSRCSRKIILLTMVIVTMFALYNYYNLFILLRKVYEQIFGKVAVFTPGCRILYSKTISEDIMPFHNISKIKCSELRKPKIVKSDNQFIYIDKNALKEHNISGGILCGYRPFQKVAYFENLNIFKMSGFKPFIDRAAMNDEFVEVICTVNGSEIYKDYYTFVQPKVNYYRRNEKRKKPYNVIILGIDSTSHLNFIQKYPVTSSLLEQRLQALKFLGYHKSGPDTYTNLIPLLTGKSKYQLYKLCLSKSSYFDKCPFLWNYFKRNKYATAFAEDIAKIGVFKSTTAFKKLPTDHYWNNFNLKVVHELHKKNISTFCLGNWPAYTHLLDYAESFAMEYHKGDRNFFGLFWSYSLPYDFINNGSMRDLYLAKLIKKLYKNGVLNDTFLFLMSDHGMNTGGVKNTKQRKLEMSLSLLWVVVPLNFRKDYTIATNNLLLNSERLVTVFDVYETIKSIALNHYETSVSDISKYRSSLFKPISTFRTCRLLGIRQEWCTCS